MNKYNKPFEITSICKDDLKDCYSNNPEAIKIIENLNDSDMEKLAAKLADLYCGCCFWQSLETIFEDRFLNK